MLRAERGARPNDRNDGPPTATRGIPGAIAGAQPSAEREWRDHGQRAAFRSPAAEPATAAPRREVSNAMRALHEMPPFARERESSMGGTVISRPKSGRC